MQQLHLLCFSLLMIGRILDVHGGNNVLDCCLRTKETPIPWRIVQDYRLQLVQDGCNIPAAVFITTKGKRLCAPLQAPWVVLLQKKLDASSARKVRARNGQTPGQIGSKKVHGRPQCLEWGRLPAVNPKLKEPICFHLRPSLGPMPALGAGQSPACSVFFPLPSA